MFVFVLTLFFCFVLSHFWRDLPQNGYQSRACGFIRGFEGCDICSGGPGNVNQSQIYVDCSLGNDGSCDGSTGSPCKTIQYAFDTFYDDNMQNIFCFSGVCSGEELIHPTANGLDGIRTVEASGSEENDFEYSKQPFMLVGWDKNQNGEYPPYDEEDIAVIDGTGLTTCFGDFVNSRIEIAHFTVKNYGTSIEEGLGSGFWKCSSGGTTVEHVYFHDIEIIDVNKQRPLSSSTNMFSWFGGTYNRYISFENFLIHNVSSYMSRGSAALNSEMNNKDEYIRFQSFEIYALAPEDGHFTLFKIWGHFNYFEILDSRFYSQVNSHWRSVTNGHVSGVLYNICAQDVTVRNNYFDNFALSFGSNGFTGYQDYSCWDRGVTGILFDHNYVFVSNTHFEYGNFGVILSMSDDSGTCEAIIGDAVFSNNIFNSTNAGFQSAICYDTGNDKCVQNGIIQIFNNTISGGPFRYDKGAISIGTKDQTSSFKYRHEKFLVYGNVVTEMETGERPMINSFINVFFNYHPSQYFSDYNLWSCRGGFDIDGYEERDLLMFSSYSGYDEHSKMCGNCTDADDGCFVQGIVPEYHFYNIPDPDDDDIDYNGDRKLVVSRVFLLSFVFF